jgi:hypothetical protein
MSAIDNHETVRLFASLDEGQFIYTELLDRSKATRGNNRVRLLRTFYHSSMLAFDLEWHLIKSLCDSTGCRAYTRLAPRSYEKVGKLLTQLTVETAMQGHWKDMRHLYARACGRVKPEKTMWLFDVDAINESTEEFKGHLDDMSLLLAIIPSRKGEHIITKPYWLDGDGYPRVPADVQLHKDNPTNLYIPEHAA